MYHYLGLKPYLNALILPERTAFSNKEKGRFLLGRTNLFMSFPGFLCNSKPTFLVGSRRFLLCNHTERFVSCFRKILSFYHASNEPESPQLLESTQFHRLHQQFQVKFNQSIESKGNFHPLLIPGANKELQVNCKRAGTAIMNMEIEVRI